MCQYDDTEGKGAGKCLFTICTRKITLSTRCPVLTLMRGGPSERGPGMPGTRHEPAAAGPARVATVRGWRDLRALEPALDALQRAAGIPVTARLAWWRAALMADRDIVPLLLAMRGLGGTLLAAALGELRGQGGGWPVS